MTGPPDKPEKKDSWAQRALAEPRLGLAKLVGALVGLPGASYIAALHHLVAGKYSTVTQVVAVVVFVVIDFLLIIIPYAFLELRPEATKARLKRTQATIRAGLCGCVFCSPRAGATLTGTLVRQGRRR